MLSAMHFPQWLMLAGAIMLVVGFMGFKFRQNKNGALLKLKAKGK
jgi:hypothetical protein